MSMVWKHQSSDARLERQVSWFRKQDDYLLTQWSWLKNDKSAYGRATKSTSLQDPYLKFRDCLMHYSFYKPVGASLLLVQALLPESADDIQESLDGHNNERAQYRAASLVWNDALVNVAQSWVIAQYDPKNPHPPTGHNWKSTTHLGEAPECTY
ncbi:hypothetical protein BS17DRAFT_805177 [Gyrodon lividus]|nr:hypothetical protein BS17DRAFT_805177 [Gyrodon lividus]